MVMLIIGNHKIEISHENKVLFPHDDITKNALVTYYMQIASHILPFMKNRALTIQRFPEGIEHEGFFQQHISNYFPRWFKSAELPTKSGARESMQHILCQDVSSLVYLVGQGMITPHRWLSYIQNPEFPDVMIIDIDCPINKFKVACEGAKFIRDLFLDKKLISFVMTTGSKGLHVVVPMKPKIIFSESRAFLKTIVEKIVENYPDDFTIEIRKEKREERIYLDTMRNNYGHTAVVPYAVRALPGAPVATPLSWDEIDDADLNSQKFNIKNVLERLERNVWEDFESLKNQVVSL